MIKISILGTGNVGTHLIKNCIVSPNIDVIEIYNRSIDGLKEYENICNITTSIKNLKKAEIYIIALPDDVIGSIDFQHLNGLIVHTSGTTSFEKLKAKRKGIFYPAQSFTKSKEINFEKVPVCIETEFDDDFEKLHKLANYISETVYELSEEKRQKLHLAAVFANNFSNFVINIAHDICDENKIDIKILEPLIQETFSKIKTISPESAQTGPAVRNDVKTLGKHLQQLEGNNKEIYNILTKSIQEKHGTKL